VNESSIFGISIRGLIAMFTVVASFVFLFGIAFGIGGTELVMAALTIVGTTLGLVTGFYFGQKTTEVPPSDGS
jgi:hypothetical protein